jgi:TetR/AcrR family transcriptional regulator, cholesterol catabolism regulator
MARDPATDTAALVAASAQVFRQKGYRNATIDDIALAAGISRPTVYKYTKSKQHLLDLMVTHVTSYLGQRAEQTIRSTEPAPVRLRNLLRLHVEAACTNGAFYSIVLREEVELSAEARDRHRVWAHDMTRDFANLLDECLIEEGRRGTVNTTVLANLVLSMTSSLHTWYDSDGAVDEETLLDQLFALVRPVIEPNGATQRQPVD